MKDLISRQAAIKAVEDLPNCYNGFSDTYDKACIIGLLEELPSAQTETVCIAKVTLSDEQIQEAVEKVKNEVVQVLPPAERKGKWIIQEGACEPDYMECSRCKWITEYYGGLEEEWNFCPRCGADMRGEEDGNER